MVSEVQFDFKLKLPKGIAYINVIANLASNNEIPSNSKSWILPKKLKKIPKQIMRSERANILVKGDIKSFLMVEQMELLPHDQNEKGKTRSVGVQPFQSACSNGGWRTNHLDY
jgi:hypothetical protein